MFPFYTADLLLALSPLTHLLNMESPTLKTFRRVTVYSADDADFSADRRGVTLAARTEASPDGIAVCGGHMGGPVGLSPVELGYCLSRRRALPRRSRTDSRSRGD